MPWRNTLPVEKKKLSTGTRYRYRKMVKGTWLRSPFTFTTSGDAAGAEAEAVQKFLMTGQIPSTSSATSESVHNFLTNRVRWLKEHRSEKHAKDNEYLFALGLKFAPEWKDRPTTALTPEMVEKWADKWSADLQARGKSRLSVNKALIAFQGAWNFPWGSRRGRRQIQQNPFAMVERFSIEHRAKKLPTTKEVKMVLKAAQGEKQLYLEIMTETGARPGEARKIKLVDISFAPPSIVLFTRKKRGGSLTPRRVPISKEFARRLMKWINDCGNAIYLFEQEGKEEPRTVRWALNIQLEACAEAKVPYFTLHSWRHWHASKLLKGRIDLAKIQRRLGHENVSTTDKYIHELAGV